MSLHADGLPGAVELAPVACLVPVIGAVGQELSVVLALVVHVVKQVLAVELHEREYAYEE